MDLEGLAPVLLWGAVVVLAAVIGVRVSSRIGLPGLLLFLLLGLAIDWAVPALDFHNPELATILGYAALVIILAEGGLTTNIDEVRPVLWPAVALATIGVALSIGVVALTVILLTGLEPRTAVLLAAVLAATDAAAVFSVLRRLHLKPQLRALLEAEAGFNDAPVVVLVVVLSTTLPGELPLWEVPLVVILELVGGAVIGAIVGGGGRWLMPRLALPAAGLYPIAVMALLIGAYGLADVLNTSGFLATYVAGVIVGSTEAMPHRRSVVGFAEGFAWTAQIGLFVMLGLLADPARAVSALPVAIVTGVALVVLGRPLAALTLVPFRIPRSWVVFTSFAGLRGAVPIVFAAIPLGAGVAGAETVFDATLILVIVLTLVQAPTLPWAARRLGVSGGVVPDQLEVESAPLDRMNASLLGFEIPERSRLSGLYIGELRLPHGSDVALVVRDGEGMVPNLHTRLRIGDQLLVVATEESLTAATRRLRLVSEHGRLAGWLDDGEADRGAGGRGAGRPAPGTPGRPG